MNQLETLARGQGKMHEALIQTSHLLIDGHEVTWPSTKYPANILRVLSRMCSKEVTADPAYNGQGRERGKMVKPSDDTPIGFTFKIKEG